MPEVMTIGEPMVNLIADSTETYLEARQLPRQMAGAEFNVPSASAVRGTASGTSRSWATTGRATLSSTT